MNIKDYLNTKNYIILAIAVVIGVFMWWFPEQERRNIMSEYRKGLEETLKAEDLTKEERKKAEETLRHYEEGQVFEAHQHDTGDFMHQDYFGEPWRVWANTFVIWGDARLLFYVFIGMLILRPFLNQIADKINIYNLKLKGVEVPVTQAKEGVQNG